MAPRPVVEWLLEEEQPAVRYRTMVELLHHPPDDPDVRAARAAVPLRGWAAEILAARSPDGRWESGPSLYSPKYTATNWQMLLLSDLGITREHPPLAEAAERWMRHFATKDGGLGGNSKGTPHHCVAGNLARAAIRFGYADDGRVRRTMEWLEATADPKGGWSCWGIGRNLDSWEGLSAFAEYPRAKWTAGMTRSVERGAEFFLERELHRQGDRYAPWYRFHHPVHYYYDILVGLDVLTRLGYGSDPRLAVALDLLEQKRRPDGRWNLDAVHPDVGGAMGRFYREHPPTPLALETAGAPSKMITLTALEVLDRVGRGPTSAARRARAGGARGSTRHRTGSARPGRPPRSRGRTASS